MIIYIGLAHSNVIPAPCCSQHIKRTSTLHRQTCSLLKPACLSAASCTLEDEPAYISPSSQPPLVRPECRMLTPFAFPDSIGPAPLVHLSILKAFSLRCSFLHWNHLVILSQPPFQVCLKIIFTTVPTSPKIVSTAVFQVSRLFLRHFLLVLRCF